MPPPELLIVDCRLQIADLLQMLVRLLTIAC